MGLQQNGTMKRRSFFSILVASVLGLLLLAAGGIYWFLSQTPLGLLQSGSARNPAAALFVPKQAPLMVSLLINPDELEAFKQVVTAPGNRRRSRTELSQFKDKLLANTGLEYQRDIQPWLGDEITFAITNLDIDRDRVNGQQTGYLILAATKDPEQSKAFLDLFWQQQAIAGTELIFEDYQGVQLIYSKALVDGTNSGAKNPANVTNILHPETFINPLSGTWATAVVGDRFVLFANQPKVLRNAINNVQAPGLNLNSSKAYQDALQQLNSPRLGFTFINLPQVGAWLSNAPAATIGLPSGQSQAFSQLKSPQASSQLMISFGLNPQGLLADSLFIPGSEGTNSDESFTHLGNLAEPVQALQYMPANVGVVAAGENLQQLWQRVSNNLEREDAIAQLVNQLILNCQKRWGVNLPEDIFSWVQGEYALGLLPTNTPGVANWIFVTHRSDQTDTALAQLDAIAKEHGFSSGPFNLENQQIIAWTKLTPAPAKLPDATESAPLVLSASVQGVRASVGDYEIFTNSIDAMAQALQAPQRGSLLAANNFQQSIAALARPNHGYLYIDWPGSKVFLERQLPVLKLVEIGGKALFERMRSLTLSSYGTEGNINHSAALVRLR